MAIRAPDGANKSITEEKDSVWEIWINRLNRVSTILNLDIVFSMERGFKPWD